LHSKEEGEGIRVTSNQTTRFNANIISPLGKITLVQEKEKILGQNLAWMCTSMSINLYTFEISNDFGAC
jgi:hypothetical protein